jgi:hypothetical protein
VHGTVWATELLRAPVLTLSPGMPLCGVHSRILRMASAGSGPSELRRRPTRNGGEG